jgi:hypothetical protein
MPEKNLIISCAKNFYGLLRSKSAGMKRIGRGIK